MMKKSNGSDLVDFPDVNEVETRFENFETKKSRISSGLIFIIFLNFWSQVETDVTHLVIVISNFVFHDQRNIR